MIGNYVQRKEFLVMGASTHSIFNSLSMPNRDDMTSHANGDRTNRRQVRLAEERKVIA